MRALIALLSCSLFACASATTQYTPQVLAKDELTLSYDGRFMVSANGFPVARGLRYRGLAEHVRCNPQAHDSAVKAERAGGRAIAFAIAGGLLGGLSLGAFASFASPSTSVRVVSLTGGVLVAALGTVFSALSFRDKNEANGRAVDAMNYYNDAVFSGTCLDK